MRQACGGNDIPATTRVGISRVSDRHECAVDRHGEALRRMWRWEQSGQEGRDRENRLQSSRKVFCPRGRTLTTLLSAMGRPVKPLKREGEVIYFRTITS